MITFLKADKGQRKAEFAGEEALKRNGNYDKLKAKWSKGQ